MRVRYREPYRVGISICNTCLGFDFRADVFRTAVVVIVVVPRRSARRSARSRHVDQRRHEAGNANRFDVRLGQIAMQFVQVEKREHDANDVYGDP